MTCQPLVSVVMCTYNGKGVIEKAVASIRDQTLVDWELVISDDGSTDGTREWLLEQCDDRRIRLFLKERNVGYVRNKNFAISKARGHFVTQQDQDDWSHPERLERQVEALRRTGLEIAGCGYHRINQDGAVLYTSNCQQERIFRERGLEDYPFWFPSLMSTKRVHEEIGPFHEYFSGAYGDDLYWSARANELFPIVCLPEPLYSYVDTPASITSLMDNPRKLIIGEVLSTLLKQRLQTGTDWLEQGNKAAIEKLEQSLRDDRRFLAGRYQTYAARSIDQRRFAEAMRLLVTSFRLAPGRGSLVRTVIYLLRSLVAA